MKERDQRHITRHNAALSQPQLGGEVAVVLVIDDAMLIMSRTHMRARVVPVSGQLRANKQKHGAAQRPETITRGEGGNRL